MKYYSAQISTFKSLIIFFIILLFLGCDREKETNVKLEILNSEIFSVNIDSSDYRRKYKNSKDRSLALNVLKFKLTNYSNKKLLFVIDAENMNEDGSFYFQIQDTVNVVKDLLMPLVNFTDESVPYFKFNYYQDSIMEAKYLKLGVKPKDLKKYIKYTSKSFVLSPKESKTFNSFISLPLINELNIKTASSPIYYRNLSNGDCLSLTYKMNFSDYKNILQEWQIKELEENKIEFFEGEIISNCVPIKFVESNIQ